MTNEDKAKRRMATAIHVMREWSPDWYRKTLLMLIAATEPERCELIDKGLVGSELQIMELMSQVATKFPDDWMPRVVRWMMLVDLKMRDGKA